MTVPASIPAGGTDEEIEKYLLEFAGRAGGWAARDARHGGWVVGAGVALSTNPNTVPWSLRVSREGDRLAFRPEAFRLPWTRRKGTRIAGWRQGQLADFLEARLRGGDPDRADARRLRAPFDPFGSTPAAVSASFAWGTACACGALALAFLALLLPGFALMHSAAGEIAARARAVEAAGDLPLPSLAEAASMGFGSALGAAALFALPVAFFLGLVHAVSLLAGEFWPRAARLGQASFAFQAIFLAIALVPLTPFYVTVPCALHVPFATHAGYTIVWGRRGERVREGGPPRRTLVATAALVTVAVVAALVPRPAGAEEFRDRLALFRDRYLVGHPPGRAAALFYYRHTLATAEPVKRFFAADPGVPERSRRTARVEAVAPAKAAEWLRGLDFSVVPEGCPADVVAGDGMLASGGAVVRWDPATGKEGLARALDGLSAEAFRGRGLLDLTALSWRAVFHAGPLFMLVLFVGFCCPMVSVIFRALPPRSASISLLLCLASTVGLMLWDYSRQSEASDRIEGLRADPQPDRLARALGHPAAFVRHEAAYRAFKLKEGHAAMAKALLEAADDDDFRVRLWAVAALGKTRDPKALDRLLARLKDREFLVRYRAAEGLGFLGDPRAVEPLRDLMRNGSWYEGLYALEALRRIDPDRF